MISKELRAALEKILSAIYKSIQADYLSSSIFMIFTNPNVIILQK